MLVGCCSARSSGVQAPSGRVVDVRIRLMTASASSKRPLTTSHLGDSGRMNSAAACVKASRIQRQSLTTQEIGSGPLPQNLRH